MSRGEFLTLSGASNSKIEIKQSVFIGQAVRISSPEEADEFVRKVKTTYPDARHNCYAWILSNGVNMQKYSDDGEPSGTAGLPLLSVLEKNGLTDCAVAVTRYFGGILLGKGGLVRAYTDTASEAVRDAGIVRVIEGTELSLIVPYDMIGKMTRHIESKGWEIINTTYFEKVEILFLCPSSQVDDAKASIIDVSAGTLEATKAGTREMVISEDKDIEQ